MIVNCSISRNVNFCQLDCLSTNLRKTIFGENLLLMRKKILLTIIAATAFFQLPANISNMESLTEIDLSVHIINEGVIIGPSPKVPAWTPRISIEDHVLYFNSVHETYLLSIIDGSETTVYQTLVPDNVNTIPLPNTLSGTYGLMLSTPYYYYAGVVSL